MHGRHTSKLMRYSKIRIKNSALQIRESRSFFSLLYSNGIKHKKINIHQEFKQLN